MCRVPFDVALVGLSERRFGYQVEQRSHFDSCSFTRRFTYVLSLSGQSRAVEIQARQTEKAAKCPEPLCPTRVLPPLGRRDPSPERTLLLRLRSYWLMRRSHWALSSFGFWPRSESPCRL